MVQFGSKNNTGNGSIPSYDNLIDQVRQLSDSLGGLVTDTAIGKKDFAKTAKLITANITALKGVYFSLADAMKDITASNKGADGGGITNKDIRQMKAFLGILGMMGDAKMVKTSAAVAKNVQAIGKALADVVKKLGGKNSGKTKDGIKNLADIIDLLKKIVVKSVGLVLLFLPTAAIIVPGMVLMVKFIDLLARVITRTDPLTDAKMLKKLRTMDRVITSITLSFLLLIGGMIVVSKFLSSKDLIVGTIAFVGFVGVIIGLVAVLASRRLSRSARRASLLLMSISLSFILFVGTFAAIAAVGGDPKIYTGILQFALMVGLSVGLFVLINAVKGRIFWGSLVMVLMSASLLLFTIPYLAIMSIPMGKDAWMRLGIFSAFVVGVATVTALVGLLSPLIALGAGVMLLMSIPLLILTLPYLAIIKINPGDHAQARIDMFCSFVKSSIGLLTLAGAVTLLALPGAVTLTAITLSLLGAYVAYKKITTIDSSANEGFGYLQEMILKSMGMMSLVALSSPLVLPGTIVLGKMAKSLKKFSDVYGAVSKFDSSAASGFAVISDIIDSTSKAAMKVGLPVVGLIVRRGAKNLSIIGDSLKSYAKAMKILGKTASKADSDDILAMVESIGPVTESMKSAVNGMSRRDIKNVTKLYRSISKSIRSIAKAYKAIGKVKGDPEELSTTITTLVGGAVRAFATAANDPDVKAALEESDGWGLKAALTGQKSVISKILGLSKSIGGAISSLAKGVFDMAQLRVDTYDSKGKKTGTRQLTADDFTLAGEGISKLITCTITALETVADNPSVAPLLNESLFKKSTAMKVIEASAKAGEAVGLVAKSVSEMENMSFTDPDGKSIKVDPEKASVNIQKMVKGMLTAFDGVKINDKGILALKSSATALDGMVETTNKIDLRKAEKMTDVLGKLIEVGKGVTWNFDKLADIINGKLIDTLEKLKEAFTDMNETIENASNPQVPLITPPVDTNGNITPSSPSTSPSGDGKSTPELKAIQDMLSGDISEIRQALQDIADASRTGGVGVYLKNPEDIRL